MKTTFAVATAFGTGGLGRDLEEAVDQALDTDTLARYYCSAPRASDPYGFAVSHPATRSILNRTPVRFSPAWRAGLTGYLFDRRASTIVVPGERHVGWSLHTLKTFRRLRAAYDCELALWSPTSHIDNVRRQHQLAYKDWPVERTWLNQFQVERAVAEYAVADRIIVAGDYVRSTFLDAGIPAERIEVFARTPAPRFQPTARDATPGFGVIYVGSLTVHKGVPLLIDAFNRLRAPDARLTLVGGWGSRPMRRFILAACQRDPRLAVAPGDPLQHMASADLCVHPSYEDGWAYAAAEALACGVPTVVTDHTGAKELIKTPADGRVIPAGDIDALVDTLQSYYSRGPRSS